MLPGSVIHFMSTNEVVTMMRTIYAVTSILSDHQNLSDDAELQALVVFAIFLCELVW